MRTLLLAGGLLVLSGCSLLMPTPDPNRAWVDLDTQPRFGSGVEMCIRDSRIRIGQRSSIQDGSVLHITHAGPFNPDGFPLSIGDEVTVGHKVLLHGCSIGNRVLVGMGSIVMDGAVIEDEVILGAGSLVPPGKVLESGFLYVGSPAKKARPLSDKERGFFAYTAGNLSLIHI